MDIIRHSTDLTPPGQRAGAWSRAIAETYFPLHLSFRDPECF